MKKGFAALLVISIAFLAILSFLPLAYAANMEITVQTLPKVLSVQVNVINPNSGDAIRSLSNDTDSSGKVVFSYMPPIGTVSFYVIVREDGKIILTKRTGNYADTSGAITIEVLTASASSTTSSSSSTTSSAAANTSTSASATNTTNTTSALTTAATNTSNQTSGLSLALSSFMGKAAEKFRSYMWYIIGIVVLGGVVYFVMFALKHKERFRIFKREQNFVEIKPKTKIELRSETRDAKETSTGNMDKRLIEAERKIREAQDEIERIKNRKQMVSEAEKRFEEAKRELEKLKKGI